MFFKIICNLVCYFVFIDINVFYIRLRLGILIDVFFEDYLYIFMYVL